MLDIQSELVD